MDGIFRQEKEIQERLERAVVFFGGGGMMEYMECGCRWNVRIRKWSTASNCALFHVQSGKKERLCFTRRRQMWRRDPRLEGLDKNLCFICWVRRGLRQNCVLTSATLGGKHFLCQKSWSHAQYLLYVMDCTWLYNICISCRFVDFVAVCLH